MTPHYFQFNYSLRHLVSTIAVFLFLGLPLCDALANSNTPSNEMAQAPTQDSNIKLGLQLGISLSLDKSKLATYDTSNSQPVQNKNTEQEEDQEEKSKEAKQPKPTDFKNRLSKRRISEYASSSRELFDQSLDVGYSMAYSQADSFLSTRGLGHGFFLSTGLGERSGISLSLDRSTLKTYDTFGAKPELLEKSTSSSAALSLNQLLLTETAMLPSLVANFSFGGGGGQGMNFQSRGAGLSTSRTLESASLFGAFQFQQSKPDGGDWVNSHSLGFSYILTVNHRLAAGLGYQLSKSASSLSVPSTSATLVYRLLPDWVVRGTASRVSGLQESNNLAFDVTYTFQP